MKPCKYGAEKCIENFIQKLPTKYVHGIEKLGIPSIDPFKFDGVELGSDKGPIALKLTFKDCELTGLKKMKLTQVKGLTKDFDGKTITIKGKVPVFKIDGNLEMSGQIIALPLSGTGKGSIKLKDVHMKFQYDVKSFKKDGKEYLRIDEVRSKITTKG